jgi:hypothetical protein
MRQKGTTLIGEFFLRGRGVMMHKNLLKNSKDKESMKPKATIIIT